MLGLKAMKNYSKEAYDKIGHNQNNNIKQLLNYDSRNHKKLAMEQAKHNKNNDEIKLI